MVFAIIKNYIPQDTYCSLADKRFLLILPDTPDLELLAKDFSTIFFLQIYERTVMYLPVDW